MTERSARCYIVIVVRVNKHSPLNPCQNLLTGRDSNGVFNWKLTPEPFFSILLNILGRLNKG